MKLLSSIIGLIYFAILFIGCDAKTNPQQTEITPEKTTQHSIVDDGNPDTHLFKIAQQDQQLVIVCNHKHHRVTDDTSSESIAAKHGSTVAQFKYTYLIDDQQIKWVTVRVDESVPTSGVDNWRTQIKKSLKKWNAVSGTRVFLKYTTAAEADITIQSDVDGELPDYALGSAYYPLSNNTLHGTLRLNLDAMGNRPFSSALKTQIVSHELGHALGLGHTNSSEGPYTTHIAGTKINDGKSLMNTTTYLHIDGNGELNTHILGFTLGDIDAIRLLYPDYSASLAWDNTNVLMFKGNSYVMYDISTNTIVGTEKSIESDWPGLTDHFATIDAAVHSPWNKNRVFFFRGNKCIEYQKSPRQIISGPKKTGTVWPGLGDIVVQAAIASPWNAKQLLFFSGKNYYKYVHTKKALSKKSPQKIKGKWGDLKFSTIDNAFISASENNSIYFFKNRSYSMFDTDLRQQEVGFPAIAEENLSGLY
ncbi:MAG: M57 family metalloprotease [Fibrobacterales bacterium]